MAPIDIVNNFWRFFLAFILGAWILICGIRNKPPFESQQVNGRGWKNSRFLNRNLAIGTGIVLIGLAIYASILQYKELRLIS
jgi:hypothetical protein